MGFATEVLGGEGMKFGIADGVQHGDRIGHHIGIDRRAAGLETVPESLESHSDGLHRGDDIRMRRRPREGRVCRRQNPLWRRNFSHRLQEGRPRRRCRVGITGGGSGDDVE